MQNLLFWECEDHPLDSEWGQERIWQRFEGITQRLLTCIRGHNLPHYFNPKLNLLKDKDDKTLQQERMNIEKFMRDPAEKLRKALNWAFTIDNSELWNGFYGENYKMSHVLFLYFLLFTKSKICVIVYPSNNNSLVFVCIYGNFFVILSKRSGKTLTISTEILLRKLRKVVN